MISYDFILPSSIIFLDKKALYLKNGGVEGELGKHIAADSRKKMKSDANNHY